MKNNEYKKIKYYLYNYKKLPQKIAEREEDIIDGTNVGHNAWIKGINCESNSLENQAIRLIEDKKLIELKRWQVFLKRELVFLCQNFFVGNYIKLKYFEKRTEDEIKKMSKMSFKKQKQLDDLVIRSIYKKAKNSKIM